MYALDPRIRILIMVNLYSTATLPGWTPARVDKFGLCRCYPVVPSKVFCLRRIPTLWAGIVMIYFHRHLLPRRPSRRVSLVVEGCFYKKGRMLDSFRWVMLVMEKYRYRLIRGVEHAWMWGSGRVNDELELYVRYFLKSGWV